MLRSPLVAQLVLPATLASVGEGELCGREDDVGGDVPGVSDVGDGVIRIGVDGNDGAGELEDDARHTPGVLGDDSRVESDLSVPLQVVAMHERVELLALALASAAVPGAGERDSGQIPIESEVGRGGVGREAVVAGCARERPRRSVPETVLKTRWVRSKEEEERTGVVQEVGDGRTILGRVHEPHLDPGSVHGRVKGPEADVLDMELRRAAV